MAHFTRLPLGPKDDNVHPPLLFFAGLYDHVKYLSPVESRFKPSEDESDTREPYPTGNPIPLATFTILTTTPSKDIEWLHDRMPCILDTWEDVERWLDLGEMKGWEEGKGGTGELLKGHPGLDCWVSCPPRYFGGEGMETSVICQLTRPCSFPVPPEVGKIGKDSPTFIQPVSERSDGIKSFFQKQTTSPAKPIPKSTLSPSKAPTPSSPKVKIKDETEPEIQDEKSGVKVEETKMKAEGIKAEITPQDEEKGLGDDSNAPNPSSESRNKKEEPLNTSKIGKMEDADTDEEDKDTSTSLTKRRREEKGGAGQRTKVIRRDDEGPKAVSQAPLIKLVGHKLSHGLIREQQPAITSFFKSPQPKQPTRPPSTRTRATKKK